MRNNILTYLFKYKFRLFLVFILIPFIICSCASVASPSGGDFDFEPPKVVKITPAFNALNVQSNKIEIVFDELVQIEKPLEKVIITPPQKKLPVIQAISNKVRVELKDTLLPNTTYTLDFTDGIVDYTEANPLENFSISFSTGDKLDSLAISGKVLTAENLEPVKGIYVGLHSDLQDSAFINKPFERISRTNEAGKFTIRGIAEGKYKIYALEDVNRTYMYENPANAIAFLDSVIVPSYTSATRVDTVFNKSGAVDSLIDVTYTRFLPDDVVLRSFISSFKRQYLQRHSRPTPHQIELNFGAPTTLPEIKPLNFPDNPGWALLERSAGNDSLLYWIIDPQIIEMDTLSLQVTYNITDSLNNIITATDTLNFSNRRSNRQKEPSKKDKDTEEMDFLQIKSNIQNVMNVYDTIRIEFDQPVRDFEEDKLQLQKLMDSTYIDQSFQIQQNQLNPRKYTIYYKLEPDAQYRLIADSASLHSYSGLWNKTLENKFRVKKLDEYGNLYINLIGIDGDITAFVELLDKSDRPLRKSIVKNGGVLFRNLIPGTYYARMVIDKNNNGIWDTGNYYDKEEPEMVYYYDKFFEIKIMWDTEENWNVTALPLDKQKPLEITKNKPQEKDARRKQLEQQEEQQNNRTREQEQRNQQNNRNNRGNQQNSNLQLNNSAVQSVNFQ